MQNSSLSNYLMKNKDNFTDVSVAFNILMTYLSRKHKIIRTVLKASEFYKVRRFIKFK